MAQLLEHCDANFQVTFAGSDPNRSWQRSRLLRIVTYESADIFHQQQDGKLPFYIQDVSYF